MQQLNFNHCPSLVCIVLLLTSCALSACHYKADNDAWAANGENEIDSVDFRARHHYWRGYNFAATDTFSVVSRPPFLPQLTYSRDSSLLVKREDVLVVEDVVCDTASERRDIWVKLAAVEKPTPSATLDSVRALSGWAVEKTLLAKVVPDTPISKVIHALGSKAFKWGLAVVALLAAGWGSYVLRRRRLDTAYAYSLYPSLLCLLLNGSVVLHRSIWHYVPDTWIEYYFYPSLNPLNPELPPVIAIFLSTVWLLLILVIATANDLRRHWESIAQPWSLLLLLISRYIILFAFFAVIVPFPLLYPLSLAYWIYVLYRLVRYNRQHPTYYCGACGKPLTHLGRCPYCRAINR